MRDDEMCEEGEKSLRVRISRLARTAAGIAAVCRRDGIEISFVTAPDIMARVANLTDKQLWDTAAQAESPPPTKSDREPIGQGQRPDDYSFEQSNELPVALAPIQPVSKSKSEDGFDAETPEDDSSSNQSGSPLRPIIQRMLPLVVQLDSLSPDPKSEVRNHILLVGICGEGGSDYEYYGPIVLNDDGLELLRTAMRQADMCKP